MTTVCRCWLFVRVSSYTAKQACSGAPKTVAWAELHVYSQGALAQAHMDCLTKHVWTAKFKHTWTACCIHPHAYVLHWVYMHVRGAYACPTMRLHAHKLAGHPQVINCQVILTVKCQVSAPLDRCALPVLLEGWFSPHMDENCAKDEGSSLSHSTMDHS